MKWAKFNIGWNAMFAVYDAIVAGIRAAQGDWGLAALSVVFALLMLVFLLFWISVYNIEKKEAAKDE